MKPADSCPYTRPFRADFDECPAFQPVRFIPLSSDFKPLPPVRTCRHLVTRRLSNEAGRWYGACELGDATARRAWVKAVDPARLEAIARLRQEMAGLNALFIDRLWTLKGQQLEARRHHGDVGAIDGRMREVGTQFVAQTSTFLRGHLQTLREIDVTLDAILHLLRLSVDQLIARSSGEVRWEIPEAALAQFSPQVRLFFRPPQAEASSAATVE